MTKEEDAKVRHIISVLDQADVLMVDSSPYLHDYDKLHDTPEDLRMSPDMPCIEFRWVDGDGLEYCVSFTPRQLAAAVWGDSTIPHALMAISFEEDELSSVLAYRLQPLEFGPEGSEGATE